jgi:hypothetical protein
MPATQVTGNRRAVNVALEEFVQMQVTKEKPALNHLLMILEHACNLHMGDRNAVYQVDFSIDLETLQHTFSAVKQ